MNLKKFCDLAGCVVVLCGPGWGGKYGYSTKDCPQCMTCGFKTKREARKRFVMDTFGDYAGSAVFSLLEEE